MIDKVDAFIDGSTQLDFVVFLQKERHYVLVHQKGPDAPNAPNTPHMLCF